jgi:hypothetical protein
MKVLRMAAVAAALLVGVSATQAGFKLRMSSGATYTQDILLSGSSSSGALNGTGSGDYKAISLGGGTDAVGGNWTYSSFFADSTGITLLGLKSFGYDITATFAYTNSPSGNPATLTLSSLQITRTSAATGDLTFTLTSDGYMKPDDADRYMRTRASGFLVGGTSGSATYTSSYDTANREFGGTDGSVTNRTVYGPTDSDGVITYLPNGTPVFSLTNSITFTGMNTGDKFLTGGLDTLIEPVPAPPALVLVALGVPALGLARRFTRKAPAAVVA